MTFSSRFLALALLALLPGFGGLAGDGVVSRSGVLHLTLDSAIRMALAKNFSIQVEQIGPQIAREQVTSALGRFDPVFDISLGRQENTRRELFIGNQRISDNSVNRMDELSAGLGGRTPLGTTYDLGIATRTGSGTSNAFDEDVQSELSLGVRQPLLRGFGPNANLSQVRIARNNVQVSEWQLRQRVIDVIRDVEYAYNDLHTAYENLKVAEKSQQRARQTMQDNIKRAEIGVMTPLNITTARAEVASRQERVILARADIRTSENTLKRLVTSDLNRMLTTQVEIEPPNSSRYRPGLSRVDISRGITDALALRPDYRQQILEIQRQNITLAFQRNAALPQLDLVGSLGLLGFDNDFGTSISRIADRDRSNWSAGAVFSIPLGNRTARGDVNTARLQAARSVISLQDLEQNIIVQVDNAGLQINTGRERIASTNEASVLAAESLEAGEERLRAGTGTTFELLELQERLAEAEFAELLALSDYNKAVAEYYRVTGTILRERRVKVE